MTNMEVDDCRIYLGSPKFDKLGFDRGSLPKKCGHVQCHMCKLIGKTATKWNTSPSAAYAAKLCSILSRFDHAGPSFGGGNKNKSSGP